MYSASSLVDAVRVKAKLVNEDGVVIESRQFSMDPVITSFDMLQSLLSKAFHLENDFIISYLACDAEEKLIQLSMLNEWDLDAAILNSSQSFLKLLITEKPAIVQDDLSNEWDIIKPFEIPRQTLQPPRKLGERLINFLSPGRKANAQKIQINIKPQMSDTEFENYRDSSGRMINGGRPFRDAVYRGGIEPSLRKVAWRHLLCVFPDNITAAERVTYIKTLSSEYYRLRDWWKSELEAGRVTEEIRFTTSMVRKDVVRTDRTHPFYRAKVQSSADRTSSLFDILCTYSLTHPDVSYCQGMSDFASLLLIIQEDEAVAYICFTALMRRLHTNFLFDGKAMTKKFEHLRLLLSACDPEFWEHLCDNDVKDLFFVYRWLVMELKREFQFNQALLFLETMWSTLPADYPLSELRLSEFPNPSLPELPHSPSALRSTSYGTPTPYTNFLSWRRNSSQKSLSSLPNSHVAISEPLARLDDIESSNVIDFSNNISDYDLCNTLCATKIEGDNSQTIGPTNSGQVRTTPVQPENNSVFYLRLNFPLNGSPRYATPPVENLISNSTDMIARSVSMTSSDSGIRTQSNASPPSNYQTEISKHVSSELQFAFENLDNPCKCPSNEWVSDLPSPKEFGFGNPFLMFAVVTMILQHRQVIMSNRMDFDSIVMLFDKSVKGNDVHTVLYNAKIMYEQYRNAQSKLVYCPQCHGGTSDLEFSVST